MIIYIDKYGDIAKSGYKLELTGSYYYNYLIAMYVYEVEKSEIPINKIICKNQLTYSNNV